GTARRSRPFICGLVRVHGPAVRTLSRSARALDRRFGRSFTGPRRQLDVVWPLASSTATSRAGDHSEVFSSLVAGRALASRAQLRTSHRACLGGPAAAMNPPPRYCPVMRAAWRL